MSNIEIGTRSEDGYYWWDGADWQPVGRPAIGGHGHGSARRIGRHLGGRPR